MTGILWLVVENLCYRWAEWRTRRPADCMPADYRVKE